MLSQETLLPACQALIREVPTQRNSRVATSRQAVSIVRFASIQLRFLNSSWQRNLRGFWKRSCLSWEGPAYGFWKITALLELVRMIWPPLVLATVR
jgi:hypothetical protein